MDISLVQKMHVSILFPYRNTAYSPNNDLELMEDIMQNGIVDPVILGVGVWSRKVRLDTGNHRIYLAPKLGITHLPVIARVHNYCTFEPGNGDHSYDCPYITPKKEWLDTDYYAKPSDVLDIMEILKGMEIG